VIAQIFCTGVQLPPSPFEDEAECSITRGDVVQHSQHVIEVGEHDDEVLGVVSLDMEAVPWDAEVVHNPKPSTRVTGGLVPPTTTTSASTSTLSSASILGDR
jgi:hypothetical protein